MKIPESIRQRIKPEGLALGSGLALLAYGVLPLQTGLNIIVHEVTPNIPSQTLQGLGLLLFAATTAATWYINKKTLEKYEYCSDIHATVPHAISGKAWFAAGISTGYGLVYRSAVNPNDWAAITSLAIDGESSRLFAENIISKSTLGFVYINGFNAVIHMGYGKQAARVVDRVVSRIKRVVKRNKSSSKDIRQEVGAMEKKEKSDN